MTTSTNPGSEPIVRFQPAVAREATDMQVRQDRALDRFDVGEQTEARPDEAPDKTFSASDPISITPRQYDST